MDPLTLTAIGAGLGGVAKFVRAVKAPRVSKQEFEGILRQELRHKLSPGGVAQDEAAKTQRAEAFSERFIALRDVDGDAALDLNESGLDRKRFEGIDLDRNGKVTGAELQRAYLDQLGHA